MSNGNIFISYRRDDTPGHAGRIYDRLNARFPGRVFMDVTGISLGEDFVLEIERQVGASLVFIELMGNQWATITDHAGRRRLDQPEDFVRLEVAEALRRAITIIPVLVRGATMPEASTLPKEIAPLTRHNALVITDSDFDYDVERLIHRLETVFGGTGAPAPLLSSVPAAKKSHPGRLALLIGIGAVGLIIVGAIVLVFRFTFSNRGQNSNVNATVNTKKVEPTPARYTDEYNSSRNSNNNSSTTKSSPGSSSSMSSNDRHKLFEAARATEDPELISKVIQKLGLFEADGTPSKKFNDFAGNHIFWKAGHDDWVNQYREPEKARAYVEKHIND